MRPWEFCSAPPKRRRRASTTRCPATTQQSSASPLSRPREAPGACSPHLRSVARRSVLLVSGSAPTSARLPSPTCRTGRSGTTMTQRGRVLRIWDRTELVARTERSLAGSSFQTRQRTGSGATTRGTMWPAASRGTHAHRSTTVSSRQNGPSMAVPQSGSAPPGAVASPIQ